MPSMIIVKTTSLYFLSSNQTIPETDSLGKTVFGFKLDVRTYSATDPSVTCCALEFAAARCCAAVSGSDMVAVVVVPSELRIVAVDCFVAIDAPTAPRAAAHLPRPSSELANFSGSRDAKTLGLGVRTFNVQFVGSTSNRSAFLFSTLTKA